MAASDFINQLRAMGVEVVELGDNCIAFPYTIPVGTRCGQEIKVGLKVEPDFPLSPPATGPHISPELFPHLSGGNHPTGGIHPPQHAAFGTDWQYWSRPFHNWAESSRDARAYLSFIHRLFEEV